ncbi:MAG TPA: M14 family zinc carboxypeptidase [Euzebyales bacterium]|nr:M14 family zinc carboxypeptidase [Euzebyales bacterium]
MRKLVVVLAVLSLLVPVSASATPGAGGGQKGDGRLDLYETTADIGTDVQLRAEGYDVVDLEAARGEGRVRIEMVLTDGQARALRQQRGLQVGKVRNANGQSTAEAAALAADNGFEVWRTYSEPGGIADEMQLLARQYDGLTELVTIGETINGQPIRAMRVTADADRVADGRRPAVLYVSTQHAREWISTEVNRRLLRHFLESYGDDERVTRLVDNRELWFVLVANPDGYDWTFEEGQRLWRKNLRDNDGDGEITTNDGVDLNRNFPTNWGYDNEGSSSDFSSQTYRGAGPASEPETQALDGLMSSVGFEFLVNYHSAAELILYGVGWQVDTPTPDDAVNIALSGTDANPAIEGYDPDLSAELYITNGDTTDHAHTAYGTLAYTPELATCQTATTYFDDDEFGETYCSEQGRSGFEFPDSEQLVQFEFEKNLDFALAIADSADDPADPESPVGTPAPDFMVDEFETSYGSPQEVAVWTKREHARLRMHYSVNGGRERVHRVDEWHGGERYGDSNDVWYAEYRGDVRGIGEGDEVEVWFTARDLPESRETTEGTGTAGNGARTVESERFTFTVASDGDADVLIVADNSPGTPLGGSGELEYLEYYTEALDASGYTWDVYDVGAQGPAPHPLGVLNHFDGVVWYEGDKLVTDYQGGLDTTLLAHRVNMNMRDYLNEGGKILATGKNHGFEEFFPLQYGDNADPAETCTDPTGITCLLLSNDTYQYYFGGYVRIRRGGLDADQQALDVIGIDTPYDGSTWGLDGGDSADNQGLPGAGDVGTGTASWVTTSSVLPVEEFPQFESWRSATWTTEGAAPFEPVAGEWQVATDHDDQAYKRLARTIDLTGASTASVDFTTSYRIETDWDYFFVEVHPVGSDDWTTLSDENGHTAQGTGQSCTSGWAAQLHPFLDHYQTLNADGTCSPTGTTGEWHAATGPSDGVEQWSIDLSAYAGQQVEVSLTYATDWGTGDLGVFVDDLSVTVDGSTIAETSFEEDLGGWEVIGAPEGSAPNPGDWERVGVLYEVGAAVTTEDTILHGFGFEGIDAAEQREEVMRRSMRYLIGSP